MNKRSYIREIKFLSDTRFSKTFNPKTLTFMYKGIFGTKDHHTRINLYIETHLNRISRLIVIKNPLYVNLKDEYYINKIDD